MTCAIISSVTGFKFVAGHIGSFYLSNTMQKGKKKSYGFETRIDF